MNRLRVKLRRRRNYGCEIRSNDIRRLQISLQRVAQNCRKSRSLGITRSNFYFLPFYFARSNYLQNYATHILTFCKNEGSKKEKMLAKRFQMSLDRINKECFKIKAPCVRAVIWLLANCRSIEKPD